MLHHDLATSCSWHRTLGHHCVHVLSHPTKPPARAQYGEARLQDEVKSHAQTHDRNALRRHLPRQVPCDRPRGARTLDIPGPSADAAGSEPLERTAAPAHAEHLALMLDLGMKCPASPSQNKQGASIPRQRWSLVLARHAPTGFYSAQQEGPGSKVRLAARTLRMGALSEVKAHLVRAVTALLETPSCTLGDRREWASLVRHDDALVDAHEYWERAMRAGTWPRAASGASTTARKCSRVCSREQWEDGQAVRAPQGRA